MSDTPAQPSEFEEERTILRPAAAASVGVRAEHSEHSLVVVRGSETGRRLRFGAQPLAIGRKEPSDWLIPDLEVSARHCLVHAKAQRSDAVVTDLQSTNGTFVNDLRVTGSAALPNGALLRIGDHVLKHEYRPWSDAESSDRLDRDLEKARRYVEVLLPAPIRDGPIRAESFFMPSARLGGDAFGHQQLDDRLFSVYLIDVSGHGAGAAMHGVSIMNVLRQRALPHTDFGEPAQVLAALNDMFQMDSHAGMFFSIWYGVYDLPTRRLTFASAGHHPAYLDQGERMSPQSLRTPNLVLGARSGLRFRSETVAVRPGATLYVFSDGVFEIVAKDGRQWELSDFQRLLQTSSAGLGEPERLYKSIRQSARPGPLDDDFSLLAVTFL